MLKTTPAVFAVGSDYQIMVPVSSNSLFSVKVGDKEYFDEQNGIMRSICSVHRVSVPMQELNNAKKYIVCERQIIERLPYFPTTEEPVEISFEFHPVPADNIRLFMIADAHNKVEEPTLAADLFGNIDLLVMNGDIPNHSGEIANFDAIYKIAELVTGGNIPIVFARGNHDMRGYYAEKFAEYTPNQYLNTYYTFTLGSIWGIILDCGEDKADNNPEYGHTVSCHAFRERQVKFIEDVIKNSKTEYEAEGVEHRLVISHVPFTYVDKPPFNIEQDIYSKWSDLIKKYIKPDLMLCGHLHGTGILEIGGERDHLGQPCPVVIGSNIGEGFYTGCGIVLNENKDYEIAFYKSTKEIIKSKEFIK